MIGIDCVSVVTKPFASFLKAAGFSFIGRYYKPSTSRYTSLEGPEAQIISDAGLSIVALWEYCDELGQLTPQQGTADATDVLVLAKAANQPSESVVYFAVDFSATDDQITNTIIPYFQAVQAQFKNGDGTLKYKIGVYGEGDVCTKLFQKGLVTYTWLSGSSSFPGSADYTTYHLNQTATAIVVDDISVDLDISLNSDIGAFQILSIA